MKKQNWLVCVPACGVALSLSACVAPTYNYAPKATAISRPAVGSVTTASVGDEMVNQGVVYEREALLLHKDANIGLFNAYTLRHGYFVKQGENKNSDFYQPSPTPDGGRVDKAALADPYKSVQAYKTDSRLCVVTVFNASACTKASFDRVVKSVATDDSFQQTLIYSGKVGQKIKLGYREFSANVARPAYSNDVDYDLSESTTVGYKGARLEVIEATNDHVTYRLISNFNGSH
ncbi:hypothetical protein [Luteibacter sahnii]|uniref:hypothetical protein n=1 Tax=Luteibacter sahnii TaxID=3021977 RepID=UPI002A6A88E2|nr:hypothetical protein [Luteibacter sp. PPL193]MDY1549573.1 hypothetical protein [Luteibacter sp. PPL193]